MSSSAPKFPARYASDTTAPTVSDTRKRSLSDTDFEDDVPGTKRRFQPTPLSEPQPEPQPQPHPQPGSHYFEDLDSEESMSESDSDDWDSDDEEFLAPEGGVDEFECKN